VLTLTEAAKAVGMSRAGLFKAVKRGDVSASKDDFGHYLIDPAELFRVYKPVNVVNVSGKQEEIEKLTEEKPDVTTLTALLEQVKGERDYLRIQLDEEKREKRQLMQMLTHQPQATQIPDPAEQTPAISKLRRKLFGY
jgi:hypothetical protein